MIRYRAVTATFFLAAALFVGACSPSGEATPAAADARFEGVQERGAVGMGVDQYASTHLFDALPDGGRLEFQYDSNDPEEIATIRAHLREIQAAFAEGDFSTPAFVHDTEVPGTRVMAERREHIQYLYAELPRGGELRLVTNDPEALAAIREFLAFQREDHRAGGVDHAGMDHSAMHAGSPGTGGSEMTTEERHLHHLEMGDGDVAFARDMDLVHELLVNHRAITRTVDHLPNGIRTLTESDSPIVAGFISAHVASMEQRLEDGEVFNLFSHTLPLIFDRWEEIESTIEHTDRGVAVVQTANDPELVRALQAHAEEVTELVDEGMIAMMRGMMGIETDGTMTTPGGGMHGGAGAMHGHGPMGGMHGHGPMGGMHRHGAGGVIPETR